MDQETTASARVVGALTRTAARIRELEREAEAELLPYCRQMLYQI